METKAAVKALAALAQETRLSLFRLLVQAGRAAFQPGKSPSPWPCPTPLCPST
ncbi:hypothetical protein [Methylogaea oryzae]|uniref:hypothetical protein n=1 Tax=Methylogaea oryzae TaxID=1295382 RepID=UPI0020D00AF6|nr:hypothetical protein [Methylogaea oryzae]